MLDLTLFSAYYLSLSLSRTQVEYQVRDAKSLKRHWILVFTAYTFILWHQLTGGFRRQWTTKPLDTFVKALEAFHTAVEFRFVRRLNTNIDLFAAHKAKSGYVWA